jgi:hypothetical protein
VAARQPGCELHHEKPRHLLRLHREAFAGETDGAGVEAWLTWEAEAVRYGLPVEIRAEDLAAVVEASAVMIDACEHQNGHSAAGDFARWGRLGGLRTLQLYGTSWFALLALRRWGRISPAELEAARPLR